MAFYSPEQIKLISIRMESEKFSKPIILFGHDGISPVVEMNIYESITQPFLTGNIIIKDDISLYDKADLSGIEKIVVEFETPTQETESIEKTFVILNIATNVKVNDYTSMLTVNLIEDIGFFNNINRYSKSFTGKGEEIISSIVSDKIYRKIDDTNAKESFQKAFRYIAPYEKPFDSIKQILNKMTTEYGLPYFFFSSLNNDDLVLMDMETILGLDSFNKDRPYRFSQDTTNDPDGGDINAMWNFEGYNLEDTYQLLKKGGISASYTNVNVNTGNVDNTHFNFIDRMKVIYDNDLLPKDLKILLTDLFFEPDTSGTEALKIYDYEPANFATLDVRNYTDVNSYNGEEFQFYSQLTVFRNAFLHNLMKNIYRIYVPGVVFTAKSPNLSVGNLINLEILKNDTTDTSDNDLIDRKRSGDYIMMAKRHIFDVTQNKHNVALEIARLTNQENT